MLKDGAPVQLRPEDIEVVQRPSFSNVDSAKIHPRLLTRLTADDLARPSNETKEGSSGIVYILAENAVGPYSSPDHMRCGAACSSCYLIHGGALSRYQPPLEEIQWMTRTLQGYGFQTILTGAELLSRPDLFEAGLMYEKEYLLSSGDPIARYPDQTIPPIANAGINNVHMSGHGLADTPNFMNGISKRTIERAIRNIRQFNEQFGTNIGVGINVTVAKPNLYDLEAIAGQVLGDWDAGAIRFNRLKVPVGTKYDKLRGLMLEPEDHEEVNRAVAAIKSRYPREKYNKRVSLSGDFGTSVNRSKPYVCPAGRGEWTVVPKPDGKHEVYACLEVRSEKLQVGTFHGRNSPDTVNRGSFMVDTTRFEELRNPLIRRQLGLPDGADGCVAYTLTQRGDATRNVFEFLSQTDPASPNVVFNSETSI